MRCGRESVGQKERIVNMAPGRIHEGKKSDTHSKGKTKQAKGKAKTACGCRERKGRFVEMFRTTPARTVSPNFFVLAHASGCSFSPRCSYCYLKSSF